MTRRDGVTLIEVLVAIFVMGIGLLSLLALFPLGAMNMAQAIKDDRTAHGCNNARSIAQMWDLRHDQAVYNAMSSPAPTNTSGPSYPVYVDPYGRLAGSTSLGGITTIQRIMPQFFPAASQPFMTSRWFTLLDDMTFGDDGTPNPSGNMQIERAGRYSWAYLCRQPTFNNTVNDPAAPVELTVVVYEHRSMALGGPALQLSGENAYQAFFDSNSTVVTLTWAAGTDPPNLRRGGWIFDATMAPEVHGYFYRAVGVTEPGRGGANTMDVELQNNPRASAQPGIAIVMENVAEVFEMGTN